VLICLQKHTPRNLKQTHIHAPIHISFHVFVLYLVKTGDASERTLRCRLLPVRLVIEPESHNFFESLFKPLTFQPLSANLQINFFYFPQNCVVLTKLIYFFIKMQTSAAPDCCVIWSGLHPRDIGEAIDHVAWTAAHLCEN